MTWNDLVRLFWGQIADEDCSDLLWMATCFPMGSLRDVVRQLRRAFRISCGEVGLALMLADMEMETQMQDLHRRTELEELRNDIVSRLAS